jgi:hypothetical protein
MRTPFYKYKAVVGLVALGAVITFLKHIYVASEALYHFALSREGVAALLVLIVALGVANLLVASTNR